MTLPALAEMLNLPWLKPPVGQHWTWWVLWSVWTGFWLALLGVVFYLVGVRLLG